VLDRRTGALDVVHRDVVGRAAEDALAQQDEGVLHVVQEASVLGAQPFGAEEQAVGLPEPVRQHGDLVVTVGAGLAHDDAEVPSLRGGDHRVRQLGEVRLPQLGHGQADDPGPARPQTPRGQVGAVSQVGDGPLDPCTGVRVHVRVVVHHVRDGLVRDAREERHVPHGHTHDGCSALS
jgi:hypothetical protein